MRVLTVGTDKVGCREVNLFLPLYLFLFRQLVFALADIYSKCAGLETEVGRIWSCGVVVRGDIDVASWSNKGSVTKVGVDVTAS